MSGELYSFPAKDAFAYVDTYRRYRLEEASFIEKERDRLQEKFWNMTEAPSRYYAELRAIEHAIEYALKRKEPGLVVLGEAAEDEAAALAAGGLQQAMAKTIQDQKGQIEKLTGEIGSLTEQIVKLNEANREAQAELSRRKEQIKRMRQRLYQSNSTFMAVGAVMLMVIIVLLFLYFSRG